MDLSAYQLFLFVHIFSAITFVGAVTLAASLFPRYTQPENANIAAALHRVSWQYGWLTLLVPVFGWLTAREVGYTSATWVQVSLGIFVALFGFLVIYIVPRQKVLLATLRAGGTVSRSDLVGLRGATGLYGLAWFFTLYLMVAKPF